MTAPRFIQDEGKTYLVIPGLTTAPRKPRHRHVWYCDSDGTYCGSCGKPHPTEGREHLRRWKEVRS